MAAQPDLACEKQCEVRACRAPKKKIVDAVAALDGPCDLGAPGLVEGVDDIRQRGLGCKGVVGAHERGARIGDCPDIGRGQVVALSVDQATAVQVKHDASRIV